MEEITTTVVVIITWFGYKTTASLVMWSPLADSFDCLHVSVNVDPERLNLTPLCSGSLHYWFKSCQSQL